MEGVSDDIAYTDLLRFVRERLEISGDQHCQRHVAMFRRLRPEDTVLTVNYDLVAIRRLGSWRVHKVDR